MEHPGQLCAQGITERIKNYTYRGQGMREPVMDIKLYRYCTYIHTYIHTGGLALSNIVSYKLNLITVYILVRMCSVCMYVSVVPVQQMCKCTYVCTVTVCMYVCMYIRCIYVCTVDVCMLVNVCIYIFQMCVCMCSACMYVL